MSYQVVHETRYNYTDPVTLGHNQLLLTPRSFVRQKCISSRITVEPMPAIQRNWLDGFGNHVTYFTLEEPHFELSIALNAMVEVLQASHPPEHDTTTWEQVRDSFHGFATPDSLAAMAFLADSPLIRRTSEAAAYAAASFTPGRPLFEAVRHLTHRIFTEFKYDPRATTIRTTTSELLQMKRGVCQDFAHLQITCLRSLGLAARYVSGYLVTRPPPGKPKLVGADASHAWLAVFFPGIGWIDFDPTNDKLAGLEHITLAWGRDYSDVCPIKGLYLGGGHSTLKVSVDVSEKGTT